MRRKRPRELPSTQEEWLEEIREAYADAREAIPFGPLTDHAFGEEQLFHLAPAVAVKFRDGAARGARLKQATKAALSSYVVTLEGRKATLSDPRLAFAFCLLASHFWLGLLDAATAESVMNFVERNADQLGT